MADGYGHQTRAEFACSLTPQELRSRIISHQDGAAINHDNMVIFRDDPHGNHDGLRAYRTQFWGGLAADSYSEARALSEFL